MDQYIGGIEHAVLHLLYARFWTKVMRDFGLVKFSEPFKRLFTQGMLLAECFYREESNGRKRWFYPSELEARGANTFVRADGLPATSGGIEKMSKSKNNVVEPGEIIRRFGADTARAYVMFAGPPVESAVWSDSGAEGVHRFLRRLWMFAARHADAIKAPRKEQRGDAIAAAEQTLRREIHLNLKQACFDYERLQYNTVVSAAMKMLNALECARVESGAVLREAMGILLRTLYPVAPHITHELWGELEFAREHGDLLVAPWPQPDPAALRQDEIELVVQVNGKLRGSIRVPAAADRSVIEAAALGDTHVQKFIAGQPVKKTVVVPGKLVNLVV
jgi:leucyl-tRNA synthetase